MNDELKKFIEKVVDEKMSSMENQAVPNHYHNNWDANQLDPAVSLLGFPVIQVADASVSPLVANSNDTPQNGIFRFYTDNNGGTPHYYLWAYLYYTNTSGVSVGAWKSVALT